MGSVSNQLIRMQASAECLQQAAWPALEGGQWTVLDEIHSMMSIYWRRLGCPDETPLVASKMYQGRLENVVAVVGGSLEE